jgi:uncharacterized membrane protein YhiD involved in acid resistance
VLILTGLGFVILELTGHGVLIAAMTPPAQSPTRITAYVVSGVGFLGAGVIISDGVNVRGINTDQPLARPATSRSTNAIKPRTHA